MIAKGDQVFGNLTPFLVDENEYVNCSAQILKGGLKNSKRLLTNGSCGTKTRNRRTKLNELKEKLCNCMEKSDAESSTQNARS